MWTDPDLAWFREWFCDAGTAHTECAVPIGGAYLFVLPNETIDENTAAIGEERYCQRFYNSTDCTAIREDAQSSFEAGTCTSNTHSDLFQFTLLGGPHSHHLTLPLVGLSIFTIYLHLISPIKLIF